MITARDFEDSLNNCKKTIGKVNLDSSQRKAVEEMVKEEKESMAFFCFPSSLESKFRPR